MAPPSIAELIEQKMQDEEDEDLMDFLSGDDGDDDEKEEAMDTSFPNSVFICNVPKVGPEKVEKLKTVLGKFISGIGEYECHMPMDENTNQTLGFILLTFQNKQQADDAVTKLDGIKLDKTHTFKCLKLDNFDGIVSRPEEFTPKINIQRMSRADHRDWLADSSTREQFLLRHGTETEIWWHDPLAGEPQLYYGGEREKQGGKIWCDWKVQFSPQGSYIVTMHKPGIALWAGDRFEKKLRFAHENVKHIEFSPNEEFLLTWNGSEPDKDPQAVRFFNVLAGHTPLRMCHTPTVSPLNERGDFPHFLWSRDGKFFAECNESTLLVRDTATFDLITDEEGRKRSLKYDNLQTFQWSPKDNIIAVWSLEKANNPARLVLVEIPSRRELAARSRTQVEAKMHWQSEGDFLCLQVTKVSKTGKKGVTNLEIFRLREKNIPVDIVEIKDTVKAFHWETGGNRFSIITTDDTGHKPRLQFYVLGEAKCENVCTLDLPSNSFTDVFWAPGGQYFVCAAMQDGDLLFGGLMPDNKVEILQRDEHFMLTTVEWDPSSRYVITAVTQPMAGEGGGIKYQMEAGYAIWTFQGRQLHKVQKEKLFHIGWRSHPPSMLKEGKQSEIKKDLKKYTKRYDAMDEKAKESARQAFQKDRETRTNGFLEILDRIADYKEEREEENGWMDSIAELPSSQAGYWEKVETTIEEEMDAKEELIQ